MSYPVGFDEKSFRHVQSHSEFEKFGKNPFATAPLVDNSIAYTYEIVLVDNDKWITLLVTPLTKFEWVISGPMGEKRVYKFPQSTKSSFQSPASPLYRIHRNRPKNTFDETCSPSKLKPNCCSEVETKKSIYGPYSVENTLDKTFRGFLLFLQLNINLDEFDIFKIPRWINVEPYRQMLPVD